MKNHGRNSYLEDRAIVPILYVVIAPMNPYQEFLRCQEDFVYFAETYLKVRHPARGLIPLSVYDYQKELANIYDDHRFVIAKKFRQGGFTTFSVFWLLWKCMFHNNQRVLVGCRTDREAVHVGRIVKIALDNMPEWFRPQMRKDNEHEKSFAVTNSVMWFYTLEACRSKAVDYLLIDEAAFIPNMEEKWYAIYPTLSAGGNCIVLSTVNGVGNWFHDIYTKAEGGKNLFHPCHFRHLDHPDYNKPGWEEKMRAQLGEKGFRQEVLGEFLGEEDSKGFLKGIPAVTNLELSERLHDIATERKMPIEERYFLFEASCRLKKIL